jgi:trk system potassium uptake protein TrkH
LVNYKQVRKYYQQNPQQTTPAYGAKILVVGFAVIILVGTVLLRLPVATQGPVSLTWLEALFTATSATTVTGLVVVSTAPTFSLFGEIIILLLIQVGGIGFITLSVVLFRLIGRRMSIYERNLLRQSLGVEGLGGVVRLTLMVFGITVFIELLGALLLFTQWVQVMPWPNAIYYSIFHSISAYCNAGFDLFLGLDDPLLHFSRENITILVVLSLLITIGTLGITVIYDVIAWPRDRHLSLHTKLVLPFTIILTLVGTLLILIEENFAGGNALSDLAGNRSGWVALFTVVSSRTAGITLVPMDALGEASQLVITAWMFIGGAPASMGGGVGLSTIAVLLLTLGAAVQGHANPRIFGKTIPTETLLKATAVLTVSIMLVLVITFVVTILEPVSIFPIGFEVVSAFSNTGYSVGISGELGTVSRLLIAFTMFWGRLGPLTLIVALAQRRHSSLVKYPEEKIIIG